MLALAAIRQLFVLRGVARSRRFLQRPQPTTGSGTVEDPVFHIVLPVLREAAVLEQTLEHFTPLAAAQGTVPIVVTTARETASQPVDGGSAASTVHLAARAAAEGRCVHLHYPDPHGLKADQLNRAAAHLLATTPQDDWDRTFLVCYDADSRPAGDPLAHFAAAAQAHPDVEVLHQSARFSLRQRPLRRERRPCTSQPRRLPRPPGPAGGRCHVAVLEAGALRANRFVLAYELPRLINRSPEASRARRAASALVYSHVTGHGLAVRLSLLQRLPFPARSPLEDMHYSFLLGSHGHAVVPLHSLDDAEVSVSLRSQIEQAARWFAGPGRFVAYLRDPRCRPGVRAAGQAASAALISAEWLSCAVIPLLLPFLVRRGDTATRTAATIFGVTYVAQLLLTDVTMEPDADHSERVRRLLGYPLACELFGLGGLIGAGRLARGVVSDGKTERGRP